MELGEYVDSLPLATFNELRKVIIARHQRHSAEIAMALEYLASQEVLVKAVKRNRQACEKVIAEKCNISKDLAVRVVDRYLEMKEHFDTQNGRIDKPYE
jgi:hypothetical protein